MTYERERQTRKRRVDPKLRDCGWTVIPFDPATPLSWLRDAAIEECPTDNGPADYALCVDGRILALVEAKKITLGPQNVLTQAQRDPRGVASSLRTSTATESRSSTQLTERCFGFRTLAIG